MRDSIDTFGYKRRPTVRPAAGPAPADLPVDLRRRGSAGVTR